MHLFPPSNLGTWTTVSSCHIVAAQVAFAKLRQAFAEGVAKNNPNIQTLETRAPEVWKGLGVWHASDIWSLGVSVRPILLHFHPFRSFLMLIVGSLAYVTHLVRPPQQNHRRPQDGLVSRQNN